MLKIQDTCKIIIAGLFFIFIHQSLGGQYSSSLDSVLALVHDEPDLFKKGFILDEYDRSLMTHDSLEKWSVTEAFIELGEELDDISFTADGYARQGVYFISRSDYINGSKKIQKAISIIEDQEHVTDKQKYRLANYQNNLGIIQMRTGETVKAFGNYEAAIRTFTELDQKMPMAQVTSTLAVQYGNVGQYQFAEEYFLKAERIFNDELNAPSLNNKHGLARCYIQQEKYHKAKPYVEECQELIKGYKDDFYISAIHSLVMGYYSAVEDRDNTEREFVKVKKYYEDKGVNKDYIRIRLNMTNIYDFKNDRESVQKVLTEVEDYEIDEQNKSLQSLYEAVLAAFKFENGNIDEARKLYQKALSTRLELEEVENAQKIYVDLFKLEREAGNYEDAIEYMQNYNEIKDSLRSEVVEFGQQLHRIQYETEKKDGLITSLSEESEIKESTISSQQSLIKSGKALLVLLGSLALLLFYLFRTRTKHNRELKEKNLIIKSKSDQNETLLKEIHHRVKNNLQTISSLLYLQSANIADEDAKEAIAQGQHRVESMALIHKNLYQRDNLAGIEIKDYISRLVSNLKQAYVRSDQKVLINLEMDETELDVDTAIPLGLIINEVLTNSFKYAFPDGRDGQIDIQFSMEDADHFKLKVSDDGVGNDSVSSGFGTQLINLLSKQLGALVTSGNDGGLWTKIEKS